MFVICLEYLNLNYHVCQRDEIGGKEWGVLVLRSLYFSQNPRENNYAKFEPDWSESLEINKGHTSCTDREKERERKRCSILYVHRDTFFRYFLS